MPESNIEELALGDYLALFRRRWRWVVGTMLVIVGIVAVATLMRDKVYASSSSVLILTDANEALFNQTSDDLKRQPLAELAYVGSDRYLRAVEEAAGFEVEVDGSVRTQAPDQDIEDASVLLLEVEADSAEKAQQGATAAAEVYLAERTAEFRRSFESQQEALTTRRDRLVQERSEVNAEIEDARSRREAATGALEQLALDSEYQLLVAERQPLLNSLSTQIGEAELELGRVSRVLGVLDQPESIGRVSVNARLPADPVSPDLPVAIMFAILASLILGAVLAVVREFLDRHPFDGAELSRLVDTPVMATIGEIRRDRAAPGRVRRFRDLSPAELSGYHVLLNSLWLSNVSEPLQSIVFSSDRAGVGKTQTVVNLAQAEASRGTRVLLIDADFANPSVVDRLELDHPSLTLSDLLAGTASVEEVAISTDLPTLQVVDCEQSESASDLLRSDRFGLMLGQLRSVYDLIVIDATPTLGASDSRLVAHHADTVVVVYDPAYSRREEVQLTIDLLRNSGANLVGLVANRTRSSHPVYLAGQPRREGERALA
ncbi:MAG: AAA family ATPase [Acidimicrobiales bacterium]